MTKPRWVLVYGIWWLDATIQGVVKPALHVTEVTTGSFEVHVVRGSSNDNFVTWQDTRYLSTGNPTATRLVADEIWSYITSNFELVAEGSITYNGLEKYSTNWGDRGQLGID